MTFRVTTFFPSIIIDHVVCNYVSHNLQLVSFDFLLLLFIFKFPLSFSCTFSCCFFFLKEVALHLIGELTDSHLTVQRSFKYPGSLLWAVICKVFSGTCYSFGTRTVSAGLMALWQPIGQPCRVALFFAMRLPASSLLCITVLTQTSAQCTPALGHIPTQGFAEVGLEHQIDNRVVKGGGLGKDSCQSKSHGWYSCWVTKGCPHGHNSIWTPCCQETDANCHRKLKRRHNTIFNIFVV